MSYLLFNILCFAVGGIVSYLALKNNPNIKNYIDSVVDKIKAVFKK